MQMKNKKSKKERLEDNNDFLDREKNGKFINPVKEQDEISQMTRPLSDNENKMIEDFLRKKGE
jgi:hypothetical protein